MCVCVLCVCVCECVCQSRHVFQDVRVNTALLAFKTVLSHYLSNYVGKHNVHIGYHALCSGMRYRLNTIGHTCLAHLAFPHHAHKPWPVVLKHWVLLVRLPQ